MKTEQPPGIRSTKRSDGTRGPGGQWVFCRNQEGSTWLFSDLQAFEVGLAESDRALLKAELHEKMKSASEGQLTYGETGDEGDVCSMGRREDVLEIRLSNYSGYSPDDPEADEPQLRHTRVYFTEPEPFTDKLWALAFRTKCPGPLGLDEQDEHIDSAYRRMNLYEMYIRTCR